LLRTPCQAPRAIPSLFADDAQDFFLAHDQKIFVVNFDLGARILAEEYAVPRLHVQGEDLAFVVGLALADSDNSALLGLFLGAIRNNDSTTNNFALFDAADEDAVVEGGKRSRYRCSCHFCFSSRWKGWLRVAHEWKPPYVADFGVPRMKRRTSLAFPFEKQRAL
jgi:hypothetical protein